MKKSLFLALFASVGLFGASLDMENAKTTFEAYKMQNKIAVPGLFKEVSYAFEKEEGTIAEILTNASASFDMNNIDTIKNPVRDKNVKDNLVAIMTTPEVKVKFTEVTGDDAKGEIKASVSIGGNEKEVPLTYEVAENVLKIAGEIKMSEFIPDEFEKFKTNPSVSAMHGKVTHDDVKIGFEAPLK